MFVTRDVPSRASDISPWANFLKEEAAKLKVTPVALKWRLVNLGRLSLKDARAIDDRSLRSESKASLQPLFSRPFMEVLGQAIDEGRVSARRASDLAGLPLEDLADLFRTHGVDAPFEL
jgi:predicted HTH domain antitoxin